MNRTRFLLAIAAAALLLELLPGYARYIQPAVITMAIAYLLLRVLWTYPKLYRERRARSAQAAADERDFRDYKAELDSIRARYEPNRDPDSISAEYQAAIGALHDKHAAMLARKFGAP